MGKKTGRPEGFVIYGKTLQNALLLPDEGAGRVLKAAARLFLDGQEPEGLELSEKIVFSLLRGDMDDALERHAAVCARNRQIAAKRRAPCVTTRDDSSPNVPNTNTNPNKNLNSSVKRNENEAAKPRRAPFVPPTREEVRAYCQQRQSTVDPDRFFDYFDAGGWTDAKGQPVRSWKQKLLTWEHKEQSSPQPAKQPAPDHSWGNERPVTPDELVEDPPGSGLYRPRWEVGSHA